MLGLVGLIISKIIVKSDISDPPNYCKSHTILGSFSESDKRKQTVRHLVMIFYYSVMMLFVCCFSVLDAGMVNGQFNWILRDSLSHTERDENEDPC